MKKRKRHILLRTCIALLFIILLGLLYGYHLYKDSALNTKGESYVYISNLDNIESLSKTLVNQFGLKHPYIFIRIAEKMNLNRWMKKGRYTVNNKMTLIELVKIFREGKMKTENLIILPFTGLEKFAYKCGDKLEPDSIDYIRVFKDSAFLKSLGFSAETIYALLLPDTYNLLWHTDAYELLNKLKIEYNVFWNNTRLEKAKRSGLNPIEISILASIVAKETNKQDEMPLVAGMYINRLQIGMPLQADPSIKFALNQTGLKRILNKHLNVESPYNTYKYKGLPPGPICIPSKQSIEAVLNFVTHDYLFMCAKEDFSGYHNFAKDYLNHIKNARNYRKALDAHGIK